MVWTSAHTTGFRTNSPAARDSVSASARALALNPDVLVADEPVSALDVSIQAQILRLLDEIRERMSLSMIFITHDLRVAAQVCDRLAVMRVMGRSSRQVRRAAVFADPQAAYTKELLAAVPGRDWRSGLSVRTA